MSEACCALTWERTDEGMNYVPCDDGEAMPCTMSGLLLTVRVALCQRHQQTFEKHGYKIELQGRGDGRKGKHHERRV